MKTQFLISLFVSFLILGNASAAEFFECKTYNDQMTAKFTVISESEIYFTNVSASSGSKGLLKEISTDDGYGPLLEYKFSLIDFAKEQDFQWQLLWLKRPSEQEQVISIYQINEATKDTVNTLNYYCHKK